MIPSDFDAPYCRELGRELRLMRGEMSLSRRRLGERAELSEVQVQRIEAGTRRTRRSTLERLVAVLSEPEEQAGTLEHLVSLAGPALAPESPWSHKQAARRARIRRRKERIEAAALELVKERYRSIGKRW